MQRVLYLENLDCANCAAKMQRLIEKIKGVTDVDLSFITQKLTFSCAEDVYADVLIEIKKAIKKVEPSCVIVLE